MKKNLLLFFTCLVFSACVTKQHTITPIVSLNKEYDIVSEFDKDFNYSLFQKKFHINETGDLVCDALRPSDWTLLRINFTWNKIMDSVNCKLSPYRTIQDFSIISQDSLLLAFNPVYFDGYHDKSVVFINRNKDIIDSLSFAGTPLKIESGQKIDFNNKTRYYTDYWDFPIAYPHGKIFIPLIKWTGNTECCPHDSLIGIISHTPKAPFKRLPISFQCPPENYYWSSEYRAPHGLIKHDYLYSFFGSEPILYQYNIRKEQLKTTRIPFITVDTILPYTIGTKAPQYDGYKSQYLELFYDLLKNQLIWTARVACDSSDSPVCAQQKNFIYTFSLIDQNLKKIGEGIVPEEYEATFIPYKDGFLLPKKECDKVTFGYFTYSVFEGDTSFLRKQIRERRARMNAGYEKLPENQMLAKYLQKITGEKASAYKGAILIPESSCPACQPAYAHIINRYQDKLLEKKIAVVLIYNHLKNLNDFLELLQADKKNVKWRTSDNSITLYKDTTQTYFPFFTLWVNLRYIEFDERGNLKRDMLVNPGDLEDFEKMIAE